MAKIQEKKIFLPSSGEKCRQTIRLFSGSAVIGMQLQMPFKSITAVYPNQNLRPSGTVLSSIFSSGITGSAFYTKPNIPKANYRCLEYNSFFNTLKSFFLFFSFFFNFFSIIPPTPAFFRQIILFSALRRAIMELKMENMLKPLPDK